jgi:hypothetical protein
VAFLTFVFFDGVAAAVTTVLSPILASENQRLHL